MSQPDLFVVCKNCGSEVSPYVTECPYCGQRVRKRAPKLERDEQGSDPRPKERRRKVPKLSRLRPAEIEGIAPDTRPLATLVLIGLSIAVTLAITAGVTVADAGGLLVGFDDQPWRYVTTAFVHVSLTYQFATLVAVGVFGTLLERRFGLLAPLLVFLAAGAAGAAAAVAVVNVSALESEVLGANGAALGLLTAWLVDDMRAARRGDQRGNDMVGVAVIAVLLLALPLAVAEANPVAGPVGALAGAILAPFLGLVSRRA